MVTFTCAACMGFIAQQGDSTEEVYLWPGNPLPREAVVYSVTAHNPYACVAALRDRIQRLERKKR